MNELEKKLLNVINFDNLAIIIIEDLILGSLEKVAKDSSNPFDDAAFAMLSPLLKAEGEKALADLIAKLKAL